MSSRFTHEEFLDKIHPENLPYEILGTYAGNRYPIRVRCKKADCLHEWFPVGASILNNSTSCPRCRAKASSYKQSRTCRVGEEKIAKDGSSMKIVEYLNANDIVVEFQDEFKFRVHTEYNNFKRGNVSNPGVKILYGIGYVGLCEYCPTENKKATKAYDAWRKMFDRCYNEKLHKKYPTYEGCSVCEEWWNFQNFAKWFYDNYYVVEGNSMEVDKDWLYVGNKVYGPETCCIAPSLINSCISTHDKTKNYNLPVGVSLYKENHYVARCSAYGKRIIIGCYKTPEDAQEAYWKFKIEYVEELAETFKQKIPEKLYFAMENFKNTYIKRYELLESSERCSDVC